MAENSEISWTHHTHNHWEGCTKVGPGCDNCYAEARNARYAGGTAINWGAGAPRRLTSEGNRVRPLRWNQDALARGVRYRVFCSSLADVFDNEVDPLWRLELWNLIDRTPALDWLLLTKRIGNATHMLPQRWLNEPRPHVWLGATIVNQEEAFRDIPKLLATPAWVRFLSMEPLLGPVTISPFLRPINAHPKGNCHGLDQSIDWVIVGGESGPDARPAHPDWFRSLRDQCAAAGVPFHFKQWGEFVSVSEVEGPGAHYAFPDGATVRRVGKKVAGRRLDGAEHNGYPFVSRGSIDPYLGTR